MNSTRLGGTRKIYPGYGQNADEIRGIGDVEHNGEDKREIGLELEIKSSIPKKSVCEDPSDAFDQFFVFVCGVDDRGSPSWDEISLPSLPIDGSLLNLDDFAVYIDGLDAGKQLDSKGIVGRPAVREWSVLGFHVRTVLGAETLRLPLTGLSGAVKWTCISSCAQAG